MQFLPRWKNTRTNYFILMGMKHKFRISFYIFSLIVLAGCYYDNKEELYPNVYGKNSTCDTSSLTYTNTIQALVSSNCAYSGCHVAGGFSPDLSTYANLKTNIINVKRRAITEKTMPASAPLENCNLLKLNAWIDANMPE